jgi:hypothetical protein
MPESWEPVAFVFHFRGSGLVKTGMFLVKWGYRATPHHLARSSR